jgi:hypothetical protein
MGDTSIYNAVRNSRVNTGIIPQYQGMRTFDSSAQVCPVRPNVSDNGIIGVARDSINTYAPGCFSALDRMLVENIQRPHYSSYLNASAIASAGVGDDAVADESDYSQVYSQPYDTMFGNTNTSRPVLPRSQMLPDERASDVPQNGNPTENEARNVAFFTNTVYAQRAHDGSSLGRGRY